MRVAKHLLTLCGCALILLFAANAFAHKLKGNPDAFDSVVEHSKEADWKRGSFSQTAISPEETSSMVVLKRDARGKFLAHGGYESAPIEMGPGYFPEILPSWNIVVPPNTGYAVQLAVQRCGEEWSEWYYVVGENMPPDAPIQKVKSDRYGAIDVDYYIGSQVDEVKYRVWLFSHDGKATPRLRRFFLALREDRRRIFFTGDDERDLPPDRFNTPAPFRWQSQLARRELWGQVCCPTAAAMLLGALGRDLDTTTVVNMCYDPDEDFYGVWPRAAQTISQFGFVSYVKRFSDLDAVRWHLYRVGPIMASIQARKGELPEAIYPSTGGHLILITGYDGNDPDRVGAGWFIVNDPASRNRERCFQVKYSAGGIQKVWIDNGGVGIVAFPEK